MLYQILPFEISSGTPSAKFHCTGSAGLNSVPSPGGSFRRNFLLTGTVLCEPGHAHKQPFETVQSSSGHQKPTTL